MSRELVLTRDPAEGLPALLHPGRGRVWWRAAEHLVWSDGERIWIASDDRVLVEPLRGSVDVEAFDGGGLLAWSDRGEIVALRADGRLDRTRGPDPGSGRFHVGLHTRAFRARGGRWQVWTSLGALPLPDGAAHARTLAPFRRGDGACWIADGWLYRLVLDSEPRALGEADKDAVIAVGPHGAVLVGDGERYTRFATPSSSLRPLPVPLLATEWGIRWERDGRVVAGLGEDEDAVAIGLADAHVLERVPRARPLDAAGTLLSTRPDASLSGSTWRPREASWALQGHLLAGPGGRLWDLERATALTTEPIFQLGATVAVEDTWVTVDWETGRGTFVDGRTGARLEPFALPVEPDDAIEQGWPHEGGAALQTSHRHTFLVRRERVERIEATPPPRPEPPDHALPLDATATIAGRRFGWSEDGLLVVLSAD